jgi:hypothetical protein
LRRAVSRFAEEEHIPVVRFTKTDRKIEKMRPYLAAQNKTGRSGVAAIGVAQEYASVFTGTQREGSNGVPWFSFTKVDRRVTCYYFYLWDTKFGPAFIKICAYFPYPAKIWINGHEWAKRQATHAGIEFTELPNGFATTDDPIRLQAICDLLGPDEITTFTDHWFTVLPVPLTAADQASGYWWELSMRQVEVSRTSCSPSRGTPAGSSKPWSPTTSTSAPRASRAHRSAAEPAERFHPQRSRPRSSPAAWTSP